MNHSTLTSWFRTAHPDHQPDIPLWENNLPRGTTAVDLADALTLWHHQHTTRVPKPADITAILTGATRHDIARQHLTNMRRIIANATDAQKREQDHAELRRAAQARKQAS